MAKLPDGRALPGKLFIVEGIDGSGKSTQLDLLRKWLIGQGYCVAFSEWNSSPLVKATTKKGKKKQMLTPASFSLIHAADLADRLERQILPALKAGAIVLADRYIYTAFGRDVARGVPANWVRKVYAFAVEPTVAFYFRVPLEESLTRILGGRPKLKYYEAGMDIGLRVVDATLPLVKQQELVRELIKPMLQGALRVEPSAWREVLASESIYGRYLDEVLPERSTP
jgi:dTMP kinase